MQTPRFNRFAVKSWPEKVFAGDAIYRQVQDILSAAGATLPTTSRRPDVRLIVENTSSATLTFQNPGNHSGGKPEVIPAEGDARAVMIMLQGATLAEQQAHAAALVARYDLGSSGLTTAFIADLAAGKLKDFISEAYGPAPFAGQADRLQHLDWIKSDGAADTIAAVRENHAAYGARPASQETAFIARFDLFVKGTGTTPERVEGGDIIIAVDHPTDTQTFTTRPIVPDVARSYYGAAFARLPVVQLQSDGQVTAVNLPTADQPKQDAAPRR